MLVAGELVKNRKETATHLRRNNKQNNKKAQNTKKHTKLIILSLCARREGRSTTRPGHFTSQEKVQLPIVDGVMLAPGLVLMGMEKGKSLNIVNLFRQ